MSRDYFEGGLYEVTRSFRGTSVLLRRVGCRKSIQPFLPGSCVPLPFRNLPPHHHVLAGRHCYAHTLSHILDREPRWTSLPYILPSLGCFVTATENTLRQHPQTRVGVLPRHGHQRRCLGAVFVWPMDVTMKTRGQRTVQIIAPQARVGKKPGNLAKLGRTP